VGNVTKLPLKSSTLERIEGRFNVRLENTIEIPQSYAVSCGDSSYVITSENPHSLQVFQFGMTPHYATVPMNLINARSEGNKNRNDDSCYTGSKAIFLQPVFMKPIQSQRCCLVIALFDEAKDKRPCLLFIDELEAFVPSRNRGDLSFHYQAEVNEFLLQLNNAYQNGIFVVGATNYLNLIDDAIKRPGRFDLKLFVGPPDI